MNESTARRLAVQLLQNSVYVLRSGPSVCQDDGWHFAVRHEAEQRRALLPGGNRIDDLGTIIVTKIILHICRGSPCCVLVVRESFFLDIEISLISLYLGTSGTGGTARSSKALPCPTGCSARGDRWDIGGW